MLIDLHAKSSFSQDVETTVEAVLQNAKDAGLDAVAFTERLSSANCQSAIEAGERAGVKVFIGLEVPTDKGLLLCFLPEVDDYLIGEQWRELTNFTTPNAEDFIAEIKSRNGAVIAARPYDLEIPYNMGDLIFRLPDLDGVEVFNPRVGTIQNNFALEAASFLGLPTTAGSDASKGSTKTIGAFATLFTDDITDQASFVEALKSKNFWAVQIGESKSRATNREPLPERARDSRPRRDDDRRGGDRGGRGGDRGGRGGDRGGRGGRGGDRGGRGGDRGGRGGDRGGRGNSRGGRGGSRNNKRD